MRPPLNVNDLGDVLVVLLHAFGQALDNPKNGSLDAAGRPFSFNRKCLQQWYLSPVGRNVRQLKTETGL
jgi:hypothetical protein